MKLMYTKKECCRYMCHKHTHTHTHTHIYTLYIIYHNSVDIHLYVYKNVFIMEFLSSNKIKLKT